LSTGFKDCTLLFEDKECPCNVHLYKYLIEGSIKRCRTMCLEIKEILELKLIFPNPLVQKKLYKNEKIYEEQTYDNSLR
jgi:hypothetical protein